MLDIKKITNPIFYELKKLNLIDNKNLEIISNKTRDRNIRVIKDIKSEIIFLEKYETDLTYYTKNKRADVEGNKSITEVGKKKIIKTIRIDDDKRRFIQFSKFLKNKKVLDFGCETGKFLEYSSSLTKHLFAVEVQENLIKKLKKKFRQFETKNDINKFKNKFDVITMFHVLEHLPYQIDILKNLKKNLSLNGKLIVEVPSANDFLLNFVEFKDFKNFTFWSEHLILHTENSLREILKQSGFKKIKIINYQRYGFTNHLGWFVKKKPGGHNFYKKLKNNELEKTYKEFLSKIKKTDTLIAIAE